jgi:hypothetical protein
MPSIKPISKKAIKKIEKDAVNLAIPAKHNIPVEAPTPEIEFVLKAVTRYELNWFYFKKLFVKFEKWLISPYTRYEVWFNKSFNTPKKDDIEILFEDIIPPKTAEELLKLKENKTVIQWKGKPKKPEHEKTLSDMIYESEK